MRHNVADMHETWKEQSPCSTDVLAEHYEVASGLCLGVAVYHGSQLRTSSGCTAEHLCM
jgi:hypothetical protein